MVNFPIFERLDVADYGLFPGLGRAPGLHADFRPGLTLILGTNGLGKSTLVLMLYRLLTGPYDIPRLSSRSSLGSVRVETKELPVWDRKAFAQRVADGARAATARLAFKLGAHQVVVERALSDLSLLRFSLDGSPLPINEKESFQPTISGLVGVWSFGDWILLLRHLTFYFEDRRALVWDASAQRQVLRFLFLPPDTARTWSQDEREILELDSRVRNLNAAVGREERDLAQTEVQLHAGADIRQELNALEVIQRVDTEQKEELTSQIVGLEASRQAARLRFMRAEQERESRFRALEHARLAAIASRFPERSETARYLLATLMTEQRCLVCDHLVPAAAAEYESRIDSRRCVLCGSDLSTEEPTIEPTDLADRRVQHLESDLGTFEKEVEEAKDALHDATASYEAVVSEIQELNASLAERSAHLDSLIRQLPPEEAAVHQQRAELASLRARVETLRADLTLQRKEFGTFVDRVSRDLVTRSEEVKQTFDTFARGFLLESCDLMWSPQKERVGETGEPIDFPAFTLEMSGTDFPSPVVRTGPEQVSESQREFVDLAFRMALMQVAGSLGEGSLVIDAPESSLDAVFVTRAAKVLSRFADPERGNRLLVTSNLVEGGLIPSLLQGAEQEDARGGRVVDLFAIAAPTAALRQLREEYLQVRRAIVGPATEDYD